MGRSEREGEQGGSKRRDSAGKAKKKKAKKRRAEAQDDGAPAALNAADGGAAARPLPPAAPQERLLAAAGSHDSDSTTSQQDGAPGATGGADEAAPATAAAPAGPAAEGGGARKRAGKAAPVLPWMRVPIAIEASEGTLLEEVQGLDPRLRRALEGTGIEVLFPVQTVAWRETAGGASPAHDICICAPTGSGKTLSYALPVLQALSGCAVPRLRALVVLPTRDLAVQVFGVLAGLCPALGLAACLAAGKASLAAEAQLLASGGVDILVATPGRLIAHLEGTPGFTLRHLRFLVVDETDRLLRQAYQGWLPKAMAALSGGGAAAAPAAGCRSAAGGEICGVCHPHSRPFQDRPPGPALPPIHRHERGGPPVPAAPQPAGAEAGGAS